MSSLVLLTATLAALASAFPQAADPICANPPAVGTGGGGMGGIFGMAGPPSPSPTGGAGGAGGEVLGILTTGSQSKSGPPDLAEGPYPAKYFSDASLPGHTIYAPIKPPAEPLPVIVWGNGACLNVGRMFQAFLTEIASHGFLVISNGEASANTSNLLSSIGDAPTSPALLTESVNWIYKGGDAGKYGKIDKDKIAVSGQSCGGLESYSAAYHDDRIKFIGMFNSGLVNPAKTCLLKEFKVPIAYFVGGPRDIAYENVSAA
jgi:hypothetical protein